MINLYKQDGEILYGIKEFLLDTVEDVKNLPTKNMKTGSTAVVISTGDTYIFNGNKQWVLFNKSSSVTDCGCEEILSSIDENDNGIVDTVELNEF